MKNITRTITTIEAIAKVYNRETASIDDIAVVIADTPDEKVAKAIEKTLPVGVKLVDVVDIKRVEKVYSMPVETFVANATEVE